MHLFRIQKSAFRLTHTSITFYHTHCPRGSTTTTTTTLLLLPLLLLLPFLSFLVAFFLSWIPRFQSCHFVDTIIMSNKNNNNNPKNNGYDSKNNGGYDARRAAHGPPPHHHHHHPYPMMAMPPRGMGFNPMAAAAAAARYPPPHPGMMMHLGHMPPMPPMAQQQTSKPQNDFKTPRSSANGASKSIPVSQAMGKVRPPYVKKSSGVKWTKEEVSKTCGVCVCGDCFLSIVRTTRSH